MAAAVVTRPAEKLRQAWRRYGKLSLAAWATLILPLPAFAQVPPPSAAQQGELLQRQQQERIEEDQTRILTSPRDPTIIEVPTHEPAVAAPGSCRTIDRIEFEHSPQMGAGDQQKLTKPYLGRCLGLGDVERLLSDITRFYIDKGRPTTRVYVRPQSLAEGLLVLDIVEGRIERVELDPEAEGSLNLLTAFGPTEDTGFNLRVFEQGLDQINRLASNNASLDILPGSRPGYSIVRIRNETRSRFHASGSYDNTGQPSTGRNQATGSILLDNMLGLNDFFSYTRRQTVFDDQPNVDSRSNSLLFSVPLNALTFTGGYSDSFYKSQSIAAGGTVFVLSGRTATSFGRVDAAVWRDSRNKLELSAQLSNKRNRNFINDLYLPVSSRILTTASFDANWSLLLGRGTLRVGASWVRGLDAFGALDDSRFTLAADTPRAQFDKLTGRLALALPIDAGSVPLSYTAELEGQYGFDPLYSSEQIVIGSPFTVRGFLRESLVGDRGAYLQQELSALLPKRVAGLTMVFRPHAGFDVGHVGGAVRGAVRGTLAGVSAGLGLAAGPLNLDATISRSIARGPLRDEGLLAFVRATLSL